MTRWLFLGPLSALIGLVTGFTGAQAAQPVPWQLGLQEAASPVMAQLTSFHDLLLWIIALISIFVLVLLAYTCVRFRASANPTPSTRTHHTVLEILWTAVPVLILVVIAIPSFKLLYYMDRVQEPELTIKAIGHQWYWSYQYPDNGDFTFDAYIVPEQELQEGQPRLLTTDTAVVLPVETDIRVLVTANDVLHSWAVPAFGVKMDAVPGRINETWVRIEEPGMYYGQCSELCGDLHGFMPIMVKAVSKEEYEAWTEQAQEEYARVGGVEVAARQQSN
ncbi:MAG: cytochrome c oxidase subunit II [Pseudomonadota bacterium]